MFPSIDRVSCFLSAINKSDPPFPKKRAFEKFIVRELTYSNRVISGLSSGQIQLEPKYAASTLIHIPNFLQILIISGFKSFAQL